jgi:transposase
VRQGVEVKLLPQEGELYVLAQSRDRICKERAIRRRQLKKLWRRLKQLQAMKLSAKDLLLKLGEARGHYCAAWRLIDFKLPETESKSARFCFALNRKKLRDTRRREGRYLLRSNLCEKDPALLWRLYTQLTQIEEAFKNLKGDLAIRLIFHQLENRIEAHIFVGLLDNLSQKPLL